MSTLLCAAWRGYSWAATYPWLGSDAPEHDHSVRFCANRESTPPFLILFFRRHGYRFKPRFFDSVVLTVLEMTYYDLSQIAKSLARLKA